MRVLLCVLASSLFLLEGGCGTVYLDAPEGRRVKLLEENAPTTVHVEETVWYALWGGADLSDNHTARLIEENHLGEVRFQVKYSFLDSLINMITSIFSFSRRRIIIDGNPAK